MKKAKLILSATALLLVLLPIMVNAQDFNSFGDTSYYNAPKALLRTDASLWDQDFRDNPALLDPGSDLELIMDAFYTGSTTDVSVDFNLGSTVNILYYGYLDTDYRIHNTGTDIGFIKKLNDRSSLGFIFNYSWEGLDGDGSFSQFLDTTPVGGVLNYMHGELDAGMISNTFGLSVLYDIDYSEDFSLGAGIGYAYINNQIDYDMSGSGLLPVAGPENLSVEREMTFDYHRISPVFGMSIRPIDPLVINSSLSTNIYLGSVEKISNLFDDVSTVALPGAFPTTTFTEKLNSNDVLVLDLSFKTDGEYEIIPDKLSLPFFFNVTYGMARWGVDGAVSGYFVPGVNYSSFQGPGTIEYGNKTVNWTVALGGGVDYTVGGFDLSALVGYSHLDLKNSFFMDNYVVSAVSIPGYPAGSTVGGLTGLSQRLEESWDVVSFELGISREFSEKLSADVSARYDIGWGHVVADMWYTSPYDYAAGGGATGGSFEMSLSDREVTHTLTLSTYLAYSPIENLNLSFQGMVGIPLSGINYNLGGNIAGTGTPATSWRILFGGPSSMDINYRGWDYGGMFNIEYAF